MDSIVTEWIVDEDQCFNDTSTSGCSAMMATATNGNYDGCCHKTVQGHVVVMGMEGKEGCTVFHHELLADNIKPAASGNLWSKNSTALFGLGHISTKKNVRGLKDAADSTPPPLHISRYIRYRDNIGYPQYGESYTIGDNQYSSKNLSYCPINRFLESVTLLIDASQGSTWLLRGDWVRVAS
jgi:hypothetical protein